MKNKLLYNASMALVQCSSFVKPLDPDYAKELLDKAQEFMDQIVIDEDVDKEVDEFEKQIKKGL
jgi:mannose/cellobiose epimerase-like protein (N-acyl-D-glucosamine 2-epimerase family)